MPNKTIYVSDGDLPIYQRAQELAGGNLSAAISSALRRYIDIEEGRREGYDEITVRVGPKPGRKVRFSGVLLAEWTNVSGNGAESYRVYRGRTGKYVLHTERTEQWRALDAEGRPAGWRSHFGLGDISFASKPAELTLEVVATLDELRAKVPSELFDMVAHSDQQPIVEDLDI